MLQDLRLPIIPSSNGLGKLELVQQVDLRSFEIAFSIWCVLSVGLRDASPRLEHPCNPWAVEVAVSQLLQIRPGKQR
jgi:hypothetical protein